MSPHLGLGLIGIGRPWPTPERVIPTVDQVNDLLDTAVTGGVRFFDTAPAYGFSEQRLGDFVTGLLPSVRQGLTIATKCGEQWDPVDGSMMDHHPDALRASVYNSARLLGRIDVLHLHQTDAAALRRDSTLDCLVEMQREYAIQALGASVKTVDAAQTARDVGIFTVVQMPLNAGVPDLAQWAHHHHNQIRVIGNRPFASGKDLVDPAEKLAFTRAAVGDTGIVLTGTTNPDHLTATITQWDRLPSPSQ